MRFDHTIEGLFGHLQQGTLSVGDNIGRPGRFVKQAHLTKKISRFQRCQDRLSAPGHLGNQHFAIQNQEHGIAQLVHPDDRVTGCDLHRFYKAHKCGKLGLSEISKHFEAGELCNV